MGGIVKPNEEVVFMPTNTPANACGGKVFTIEMHHTRHEVAKPGDNVGLNIKGLDKQNMPRVGDVMIYKKDKTLTQCGEFDAQIQTLDIPGEIKLGYSPIGFVRCGRSACRATAFKFKVGKETGGKKMESPHSLKSNEMAQVSFQPQQPMVVDSFKNCEGLSRIAFLDGNTAVMLGKVVSVIRKSDMPAEEKGKKKKTVLALPLPLEHRTFRPAWLAFAVRSGKPPVRIRRTLELALSTCVDMCGDSHGHGSRGWMDGRFVMKGVF